MASPDSLEFLVPCELLAKDGELVLRGAGAAALVRDHPVVSA
jgi:hypothetical protein